VSTRPAQTICHLTNYVRKFVVYTPFTVAEAPAAMIATLLLMHVMDAVAIVGVLTTLARAR
jgi:hypothetical protein